MRHCPNGECIGTSRPGCSLFQRKVEYLKTFWCLSVVSRTLLLFQVWAQVSGQLPPVTETWAGCSHYQAHCQKATAQPNYRKPMSSSTFWGLHVIEHSINLFPKRWRQCWYEPWCPGKGSPGTWYFAPLLSQHFQSHPQTGYSQNKGERCLLCLKMEQRVCSHHQTLWLEQGIH